MVSNNALLFHLLDVGQRRGVDGYVGGIIVANAGTCRMLILIVRLGVVRCRLLSRVCVALELLTLGVIQFVLTFFQSIVELDIV